MVQISAPHLGAATVGPGGRRSKGQRAAASVLVPDAPCRPVRVRAVIVGGVQHPDAAFELSTPDGTVVGHVPVRTVTRAMDLDRPFWLVGEPAEGAPVALVSAGRAEVILPGGPFRAGPARPQPWSDLCCRMLGWQCGDYGRDLHPEFHAALAADRAPDRPSFRSAVNRFRFVAVLLPIVFVLVLVPYLFTVPGKVHGGASAASLLALPVLGSLVLSIWSRVCRWQVGEEAERIEAGAAAQAKPIAYTQSYWASMVRKAQPWEGPLPLAAR